MSTPLKIQVIIGSTRKGRFSEKPANYLFDELRKNPAIQAELVDLRDWPMAFFDETVPPSMNQGNYTDPLAKRWAAKVGEADGYVIVSPEYNHGYSAVLKNAIDLVAPEWHKKPVGFVSYGSVGGARAVEQLRQVVGELQMHAIRNAIHIPTDVFMAVMKEQVPVNPELFAPLRAGRMDRVAAFIDELLWWTQALKTARDQDRS